jgi:hypothetical protein
LKAVTYAFPPGYRENAKEEEEENNYSLGKLIKLKTVIVFTNN